MAEVYERQNSIKIDAIPPNNVTEACVRLPNTELIAHNKLVDITGMTKLNEYNLPIHLARSYCSYGAISS